MTEIVVALIGFFAMTSVALIEKVRRDNKRDHSIVAMKVLAEAKLGLGNTVDFAFREILSLLRVGHHHRIVELLDVHWI